MSAITESRGLGKVGRTRRPRADDPRVRRTRSAVLAAARTLFLRDGYEGATMEAIAKEAGLTKRTLYNNYADKDALFRQMTEDTVAFAETFAQDLHEEFTVGMTTTNVATRLENLGLRLARAIVRPEVVALRRMLIAEARAFPTVARDYYDRAPGHMLQVLADGFATLTRRRVLRAADSDAAAVQFAYLVVAGGLDRALMTGDLPPRTRIEATAREGVRTFLARYAPQR